MELEDAVAVVTGAAYGIGRATAAALARAGAHVVVADIAEAEGRRTVERIMDEGGDARFVRTDVASRPSVEALVEQTLAWRGRCDLYVSNAAIAGRGAPHEFSAEDWEAILGVDLHGSIWAMRTVLPHMLERDRGHLAFVASGWGFRGSPNDAPYSVAKFGLVGLAESLAAYLEGTGVSVSLVVPGAIGGDHADTLRVAGREALPRTEAATLEARVKAEHAAMSANWPSPEPLAQTILDGLRAGAFYILQRGQDGGDWLTEEMRRKWADADVFVPGR